MSTDAIIHGFNQQQLKRIEQAIGEAYADLFHPFTLSKADKRFLAERVAKCIASAKQEHPSLHEELL